MKNEEVDRSTSVGGDTSASASRVDESLYMDEADIAVPNADSVSVHHDEPHARLVIRHIDVENFKSYCGQHRIGPFHKTFTAVIGPNGSGKSNVIDSMLFVFGRNAKKIRLEKLSELIHNSAAHPNLTYASVTVSFVNVVETSNDEADAEQRVEVPGSEFSIKREVYRSGVSQYFINSVRKSQKEVVECLVNKGVDLEHNRFLILQGEVEQIALMKPKAEREGEEGLLEYLDDLIGTNEYVGSISAATRAADVAQVARLEALDLEQKLKAEREALDDAKNSTITFVTKDNHLQKTLIAMCQLRMRGIEERLVEPRRVLAEIDARLGSLEESFKAAREAKAAAEDAVAKSKRTLAEATKVRDTIRSRKQVAEGELEQVKSGVHEHERARKKWMDQMKKAKEEMQRCDLQQQDAERGAAIHQQNLKEASEETDRLQCIYEHMNEELLPRLRPLRQALEEKRKTFAPYAQAVTEAAELLNTSRGRLELLESSLSQKKERLAQVRVAVESNSVRQRELEEILRKADDPRHHEEIRRLQDMAAESTRRKYAVNASIQEIKSVYCEGEADDRAMEFLLSQRSLKGYYGTLRQLGRIDQAYDIAAGVASNAWGFHVVEDRATATAALELLKKNNIGRATMMVLSEIDRELGARCSQPFQLPNPKSQRLFDLIKPTNPKFRTAFYQAVRNTLVVQTLPEARETAFGSPGSARHRVVTVTGALVEPSGTITGGGAAPRGAKLKAARSPQDKHAIKETLQRLQQELIQAAEEERTIQIRLHQLDERESRLTPEQLRQLREEHRTLVATLDYDTQRCTALEAELAALQLSVEQRRASLVQEMETCEARLRRAEDTQRTEHAEIERLEATIDEAGGHRFKEVAEQLKATQARVEVEETALRDCRRLAQRYRATLERKKVDVTEFEAALTRLEAEAAEGVKEKIAELSTQLEKVVRELNAAEARLADAQAACDEARAAVPQLSSRVLEAQKKLDDEGRYRQTEAAKMADALQELAKFEQKIDGCEEKIKENADLYGVETLQLDVPASDDDDAEDRGERSERNNRSRGNSTRQSSSASEAGSSVADDEEEDGDDEERPRSRRDHRFDEGGSRGGGRRKKKLTSDDIRAMSFKLTPEELERCDYDRSVHLAKALSEETKRLHREIDFRAVALWRERDEAHRAAKADYLEKKTCSDQMERELGELKTNRRTAFMAVFGSIQQQLKKVYQLLTHGGDADLELVDVNDPFEGVHFVVRPPKKSWKQISNLSGGEKTLSSLALIFALHHIKPTPIYVMDEIDAALDFRNVTIVANYVLRQATGAQFIIISLRNNMFEMAHQLVGVCKVNDVTSTLVLIPRRFERVVAEKVIGVRRPRNGEVPPAETEEKRKHLAACEDEVRSPHGAGERACGSLEEGRPPRKSVRFSDDGMGKENIPHAY